MRCLCSRDEHFDLKVMGNQEFNLFWNEDKITYQVTLKSEKATFDNIGKKLSKDFTNNIFFRKL